VLFWARNLLPHYLNHHPLYETSSKTPLGPLTSATGTPHWHQLCIPCFVSDFQVVPRQPHRQKTSSRPRYRRSPSQWPNKVARLPPSSLCLLEMVEPERSVHSSPPQILYLHGGELPIRTFCWVSEQKQDLASIRFPSYLQEPHANSTSY
jgi:hypothetical protein